MKKKKIFLVAGILMLTGALIVLAVLIWAKFDFRRFSTTEYTDQTTELTPPFHAVDFDVMDCDVKILPSPDGVTKLVTHTAENVPVTAEIKDSTLFVRQTDERRWTERFGIMEFGEASATLYINMTTEVSKSITVETRSGGIEITGDPSGRRMLSVHAKTAGGDVRLTDITASDAMFETVSGDISLQNITVDDWITLSSASGEAVAINCTAPKFLHAVTVSGDVTMQSIEAGSAAIQTTSGNVRLEDFHVDGHGPMEKTEIVTTSGALELTSLILDEPLSIQSVSGDVRFTLSQAQSYEIKTTSGDVTGTLVTEGNSFRVSGTGALTNLGNIAHKDDPPYAITTTSGDVDLEFVS